MSIQNGTINNANSDKLDSNSSLERLERVASWHFTPFLRRILPATVKNAMRELRVRILTAYIAHGLPRNKEFNQSLVDALASASLSIIVPIYDAPEVTGRCLRSVQKYAPKAEIILVDDGSKFQETHKLLEDFATRNNWTLIRNPEPLGHSAACNTGATVATRPYLCLLNSDTVVTPSCWRLITQVFENNPSIGVAGPSTSYAGTEQALPLANFTRHYLNDSQICEYASRLEGESSDPTLTDLPDINGFAFFIRRSLWKDLGGFDRNIPDYHNETELCERVQRTGYRTVWVQNSYIHHLGGVSYIKTIGEEGIRAHTRAAKDYLRQKDCSGDL